MIIGINGKIGSGKDTVGSIIQELCLEYNGPEWEIKKFAGKLKQTASLLTGIPVEKFEDQDFKKTTLESQWNYHDIIGYGHHNVPVYGESEQEMLVREFLQKLGTEAMRMGLHTNVWVNALFADYVPNWKFEGEGIEIDDVSLIKDYPNWIITDMRFPNEMEAVVAKGGITIRVVRPGTVTGTHPSEIALDENIMHYEIINDGTIEDLVEKVREILIERNII